MKSRIAILPNALTATNLGLGFYSMIASIRGDWSVAAWCILAAIIVDVSDGRVARWTNTASAFGVEFDSLCDLVSFGAAPAMLMYHWCFKALADEFGVFMTFVFALCAASRLARFNISDTDLKSFVGLPTPAAAGMIAAVVNFSPEIFPSVGLCIFGASLMLALAYLMVSHIEYFSIKLLTISGMHLFERVMIGALIALTWYNNTVGFVILTGLYCLSGPVKLVRRRAKREGESDQIQGRGEKVVKFTS